MLALLTVTLISIANGELVGPITIMENGQSVTRYVVSTYAPLASVSGSTLKLQHNSQVQIAANKSSTYSANMFQEYKLKVTMYILCLFSPLVLTYT